MVYRSLSVGYQTRELACLVAAPPRKPQYYSILIGWARDRPAVFVEFFCAEAGTSEAAR